MHHHPDPWKWPFALITALAITAVVFFVIPLGWWDLLALPRQLPEHDARPEARWLILLPPPNFQTSPPDIPNNIRKDQPIPKVPEVDPRWWTDGWRIRVATEAHSLAHPVAEDSVQYLLQELGLGVDFMTRSRPDSLLADRLMFMHLEDGFRFDELKPYLGAMTRARAYADVMSRAADMYDDFLQSSIMVPD